VGFFSFETIKKKVAGLFGSDSGYRGNLAQTALPEMLAVIYRHSAGGLIEATQGEIVKRIYVKDGTFIHATSTDPADSIFTYLLRTGRINIEQFTSVSGVSLDSDKKRSALIIERNYLSPGELYGALRDRVEAIVWSLFWWEDGEILFSPGTLEEGSIVHLRVPIRHVIMHGVKRSPKAKTLVTRLGRKDTVYLPNYDLADLIDIALDRNEYQLLALVDGKRTLYDICARGPYSAGENAKLLYAFSVLHLIDKAPKAPAASEVPDAASPGEDEDRKSEPEAAEQDEDEDEDEDEEDESDDEEDEDEDEDEEDEIEDDEEEEEEADQPLKE
jgi:hypothetical protein